MMACVPPEVLEQLLAGTLDETRALLVRRHLADCPDCQGRLDRLSDDPRLCELRAGGRLPPAVADATDLAPLLERLRETPPSAPAPRAAGLPHGLLGPPQAEGELGTLGPYRVLAELGRGGMGVVFKALAPSLGRTVALKMLWPDRLDAAVRARFAREARAAAALAHDHVVPVYAVADPPDGPPYLAMQYVAGPTLRQRLARDGRLEPGAAARVALQVAEGLAAAHAAGLVHRDVKPANIILDAASGRARLLDFGLVRLQEAPAGTTVDGLLRGTPKYMSPEQVRAPEQVDGRADVYGLGVTLYEALTGRCPSGARRYASWSRWPGRSRCRRGGSTSGCRATWRRSA